jgi:hypothetical protein
MFSVFPDPSSPVVNWIAVHSPLAILSAAVLIVFATRLRFAQSRVDGGHDDWFGDFDSFDDGGARHE